MDLVVLYLKAAGFGLAVAAPVGPMSLLCMRRSLAQGWRFGLATGLGIAVADAAYAAVAALGLAGVSAFLLAHERPLHLAAGLFLLWLGVKTLLASGPTIGPTSGPTIGPTSGPTIGPTNGTGRAAGDAACRRSAFGSAVLLTLTNPPTIIMFAAIFAALAPRAGFDRGVALATVWGVFTGSLLWWCGLVAAVAAFRHMLGSRVRTWIDRCAGLALGVFGLAELRRAI